MPHSNFQSTATLAAVGFPGAPLFQDQGLDETLSAHYVQLNGQNRLIGTVTAIRKETGETMGVADLEVKLVQRSREIAKSRTDADGNFVTNRIAPGSYTLCISGREGFLAYGVQVIEPDDDSGREVEIPEWDGKARHSGGRAATLLAHGFSQEQGMTTEITAAVIPPTHESIREIMDGIPGDVGASGAVSGGTLINVEKSVVAGGFQVNLQADGTLAGRIAPLTSEEDQPIRLREMNVYLIEDDEILSQVVADEDGNFAFGDVAPGVYGFAAAGRDGFAALSFMAVEVQEDSQTMHEGSSPFRNASLGSRQQGTDTLNVAICPAEDIPFLRREVANLGKKSSQRVANSSPANTNSIGGGNGPGGMGGGGFSGGGGGGLGGLDGNLLGLGLAALAFSEVPNTRRQQPFVVPQDPVTADPLPLLEPDVSDPEPPIDNPPDSPILIPEPSSGVIYIWILGIGIACRRRSTP